MSCPANSHHYRLVGYRDRRPGQSMTATDRPGLNLMDAVMACTRCPEVKEVGVTRPAPVPSIKTVPVSVDPQQWDHAAALRHSNPVAGSPVHPRWESPGHFGNPGVCLLCSVVNAATKAITEAIKP